MKAKHYHHVSFGGKQTPGISSFLQFTNRPEFLSYNFVDWHIFSELKMTIYEKRGSQIEFILHALNNHAHVQIEQMAERLGDFWLKDGARCENNLIQPLDWDLWIWSLEIWSDLEATAFRHYFYTVTHVHLHSTIETVSKRRLKCLQHIKSMKKLNCEAS